MLVCLLYVCADGLLQDKTSLGLTTVCIYGQGRCFILGAMASKALHGATA